MAAIHVAGVRGDPCGAVSWTVQLTAPQGSPRTPASYTYCCHNTGIDRQDFKLSVFLKNF